MSKIKLSLLSILESIEKIENYTMDFSNADDFYHDESFKQKYSHIPWQKVKDFRNIVAHNYFGIDADEIWKNKIRPLKSEIENLISIF